MIQTFITAGIREEGEEEYAHLGTADCAACLDLDSFYNFAKIVC